jgi:hypothetical protein
VFISIPYFDRIVTKELHYDDPKSLRKWLKAKGYTQCEKDRDYYRTTIRGSHMKYVALYLPREDDPNEKVDKWLSCKEEEIPEALRI